MELSRDLYTRGFLEFKQRCNSQHNYLKHVQNMIQNTHFNEVLSIGGGSDCFDIQLSKVFTFDNYHIIEPNIDCVNAIKQTDGANKFTFNSINFQQWYEKHKVLDKKFDLIIANHCIYYFADKDDFVTKCMSLLKSNGVLIVIVMHNESFHQIIEKFGDERSLSTKCAKNDVKDIFVKNKIDFEVDDVDGEIDITGKIDPSMFHFILNKFCSQLEVSNIMEYLYQYKKCYPQKTSVFVAFH